MSVDEIREALNNNKNVISYCVLIGGDDASDSIETISKTIKRGSDVVFLGTELSAISDEYKTVGIGNAQIDVILKNFETIGKRNERENAK